MKISATIVAFNEERNIARAIRSLRLGEGCVDEIVVVDSGSSDGTREIAASLGARVVEETWRGYATQKNFAAASALNDWILSIDADEELTPELAAEISALKNQPVRFDAWTMPRLARYLGRWIRHSGWYPDRKVRLYHRERANWQGEYVHESVQTSGRIGELKSDLLHFTCDSLGQHLRTLDRYTSLAAQGLVAGGKPIPLRRLVVDPPWTFVRSYVVQRGFLDGVQGFLIACMAGFYTFLKYAKARELSMGKARAKTPTLHRDEDSPS
jgi:glycosyltransferase involved in cell wall biosynthesis